MVTRTSRFALLALIAVGFAMTGCDEAEQGRVLMYEKGTYLGPKDQPLSDEQKAELRARTLQQRGL
jgi:hypothetical protein